MKIKILSSVEKRKGTSSKGQPWVMYDVGVEGKRFPVTCFTDMSSHIGQEVEGELEKKTYKKKDGSEGYSFTLVLPRQGGNKTWDALKELDKRITALEKLAGKSEPRPDILSTAEKTFQEPSTRESQPQDSDLPF